VKNLFFLGFVAIFLIVFFSTVAFGEEVGIGIRVILASHEGNEIDARLEDIQKQLGTLKYSSYRLQQERSFLLAEGEIAQLPLPGKKEVRVKLLKTHGGTAEIAVEILRTEKKATTATLTKGGGTLLIVVENDDVILAISAQGP
jgi:hypothetical protein